MRKSERKHRVSESYSLNVTIGLVDNEFSKVYYVAFALKCYTKVITQYKTYCEYLKMHYQFIIPHYTHKAFQILLCQLHSPLHCP